MSAANWTERVQQIASSCFFQVINKEVNQVISQNKTPVVFHLPAWGWVSLINHGASALHLFFYPSIYLSIQTPISQFGFYFVAELVKKFALYTISIVLSSCTNTVFWPSGLMTLVRLDLPFGKLCWLLPNTPWCLLLHVPRNVLQQDLF